MALLTSLQDAADGLDAILESIDLPGGPGSIKIYAGGGAIPGNCAAAAVGVLLSTCVIQANTNPAFAATTNPGLQAVGTIVGGKFAADPAAVGAGPATYFRLLDFGGNVRLQGTVGVVAGADLILLPAATIAIGQVVTITVCNITIGGIT